MEYIKKTDLLDKAVEVEYLGRPRYMVSASTIGNMGSIDIILCKECRYCKRKKGTFKGAPIFFYRCEEHNRDVENDDFCSWGERREP